MIKSLGLATIGWVMVSGAVLAAEDAVTACRALSDTAARLKCFDQATAPAPGASSTGAWKLDESRSELDRSRTVAISVPGEKVSTPRGEGKDAATLAIRCEEGTTSVFVAFSTLAASASGATAVRYRLGEAPPKSAAWSGSQDGRAYGLFASKQAIALVKEMIASPELFIRGEPRLFGTTEALFKLGGLPAAIKPVREACKW